MTNWLEEACESVDACVFTGDSLMDEDDRNMLRKYINRWQEQLVEMEQFTNES